MKNLILIFTLIIFLTSNTRGYAWEETTKNLYTAFAITLAIDSLQTMAIFKDGGYDKNEFINDGVERYGTNFIPAYFTTFGLAWLGITHLLPYPALRKTFLGISLIFSADTIIHNYVVGVGFSF